MLSCVIPDIFALQLRTGVRAGADLHPMEHNLIQGTTGENKSCFLDDTQLSLYVASSCLG